MPFSAGVKERYKKKLRIRMNNRKAAKNCNGCLTRRERFRLHVK